MPGFQRLWAVERHHIADPTAILVLKLATYLAVVVVSESGGTHVRWYVFLVITQRTTQPFTVDKQIVKLAVQGFFDIFSQPGLIRLLAEDTRIKLLFKLLRQRRPIGAYRFQPFVNDFSPSGVCAIPA